MDRDLTYIPDIESVECFNCKNIFNIYKIQNVGINFCKRCGINNKNSELTTVQKMLVKIAKFAEEENEKIEDRLVVDISKLFQELQK